MALELCLVIGGGNIYRGLAAADGRHGPGARRLHGHAGHGDERARAADGDRARGQPARVLSAIPMPTICEPYIRDKALDHLAKGRVVIFAGGTGNPFFTTDTAAALRAAEMGCDALFKATQVDGVYSADPETTPNARRYDSSATTMSLSRICASWTVPQSPLPGTIGFR